MTAFNENISEIPDLPTAIEGEVVFNDDPDRKGRIKLYIPSIFEGSDDNKFWVKPIMPMGSFIVPDVGEIVSVIFMGNKPNKGYYVGRIYKNFEIPQAYKDNTNNKIIYNFRNNNSLVIDDEDSTLEVSIGNTKVVIDQYGTLNIYNGNPDTEEVTIQSPNNLTIKSDKKLSLQGTEVEISESDDDILGVLNKKARITLKEGEAQIGVTGSTEAKLIDSSTNNITINSDEVVVQYNDFAKGNLNTMKIDSSSISLFDNFSHFVLNSKGIELNGNQTSKMWLNGTINFLGLTNLLGTAPTTPIALLPKIPMVLDPPIVSEAIDSATRMNGENMEVNNTVDIIAEKTEEFKKREGLNMTSDGEIAKGIADILL